MLPQIIPNATLDNNYAIYLKNLRTTAFSGDIRTDYAARLAVATDNSIYQVIPQAVLTPRKIQDIVIALLLAQDEKFRAHIKFSPRGGGTATNGQSLSAGIIIDCSKYMCEILELNLEEHWVRVQPGVVLDQLNTYLQPHGFYFAPQVSTSSRATLGGMINTDACGNGSRLLGRTSDHVINLTCVLSNGTLLETAAPEQALATAVADVLQRNTAQIQEKFTDAPRTLTGYNLAKANQDPVNLNYIFSGAEGTLGVVGECKLKIMPLPKFKNVILIKYASFNDALRAPELQTSTPLVIETIDNKLLSLARQDSMYHHLKNMLDNDGIIPQAINVVEFVSDDENDLHKMVATLCDNIQANRGKPHYAIGFYLAKNTQESKLLWELRKKSVGLISKAIVDKRRPIPFIEDTAVPPERLADYIAEFTALLDSYQLIYGMYGHIDSGCIHIRPALDMQNSADENLIRELSDKVVALLEKYHGVMWGEHGKGYRCEYTARFFGDELHLALREIKTLFDPFNQMNPGKIVTPLHCQDDIVKLQGPLRGHFDKEIPAEIQQAYATAMSCNGNGACFNDASQDVICPSFKVTRDRIHSPKGRATVIREWLRQLAKQHFTLEKTPKKTSLIRRFLNTISQQADFSHEVYNAMAGCLSCKACATQCPLKVDVPEFKATFLAHYYQRYLRPLRDYAISSLESVTPVLAKFPRVSNILLNNFLARDIVQATTHLIGTPQLSTISLRGGLRKRDISSFNIKKLHALSADEKNTSIILLQDAFTSFYDTSVLLNMVDFFQAVGITVYIAPFFPNGKPLHIKGFLEKFNALAHKNAAYLQQLEALEIPLLGIDPSITLTYRDEYPKAIGKQIATVHLPQEWLVNNLQKLNLPTIQSRSIYYLLSHCTEKTACVAAEEQWQTVFSAFGCELKPLAAGCCGMAGSYGYEKEHIQLSKQLFAMDWKAHLAKNPTNTILATGYSCRCQAKRFAKAKLLHPLEALLELYNN